MTEKATGQAVQSGDLLDAVLRANNKWRCEMWSLQLHVSTPNSLRPLIAMIMDRQLELEDQAKAANVTAHLRAAKENSND
jgi:hypothetical protein